MSGMEPNPWLNTGSVAALALAAKAAGNTKMVLGRLVSDSRQFDDHCRIYAKLVVVCARFENCKNPLNPLGYADCGAQSGAADASGE